MKTFQKDNLQVEVHESRAAMGAAAAKAVAERIADLLEEQPEINMIFAAAPSQNEFLEALIADPGIHWDRINAFHMDEYTGLPADAPQAFGNFLRDRLFDKVPFRNVFYIDSFNPDSEGECERYTQLLADHPIDITCLGIGENGHIAFNDPHVAFFDDPKRVKVVDLDAACRTQQVNDGCFASLDEVPTHAITLTIPALTAARYMYCIVPAKTKAQAVRNTVEGPVETACPASIMRRHPAATLYLDPDSAALLQ